MFLYLNDVPKGGQTVFPTLSSHHCTKEGANCTFEEGIGGFGDDVRKVTVASRAECCAACLKDAGCTVAVYEGGGGVCHIKNESKVGYRKAGGYAACRARAKVHR